MLVLFLLVGLATSASDRASAAAVIMNTSGWADLRVWSISIPELVSTTSSFGAVGAQPVSETRTAENDRGRSAVTIDARFSPAFDPSADPGTYDDGTYGTYGTYGTHYSDAGYDDYTAPPDPRPTPRPSDLLSGNVTLRATGEWGNVPPAVIYDEARIRYSINFEITTQTMLSLSGVLDATHRSSSGLVLSAISGPTTELFFVSDDPPNGNFRFFTPASPPDVKEIDEAILLHPLAAGGYYRLTFESEGTAFRDAPQSAGLDIDFSLRAIPEPGTALLLGLGLGVLSRRRGVASPSDGR